LRRKRILAMAWESLKQRRFRTSLTTLGVVIGITAIIALASLGEGFRVTIREQMEQGFELNVLTVMSGGLLTGESSYFTDIDVQNITDITGVSIATPLIQKARGIELFNAAGKNSTPLVSLGVDFPHFWEIYPERLGFENGSLPQTIANNTVILGYNVAHPNENEIFAYPDENVTMQITRYVGLKPISINYTMNVAGTLAKSGAAGFINFDDTVFIPLDTARELYEIGDKSDMIFVRLLNKDYSDTVETQIKDLFPANTVRVLVPSVFMEQVESILNMVEIFLTSIASIALLVAGLGIMNIMTVSVMERTREIGILKAIGAKSRTVLTMFLTEAALVGLLGGLIGVPVGYAMANVLSYIMYRYSAGFAPSRSIITGSRAHPLAAVTPILSPQWTIGAIAFALLVSVIFGWYPARKAAKLDPVEALRYE